MYQKKKVRLGNGWLRSKFGLISEDSEQISLCEVLCDAYTIIFIFPCIHQYISSKTKVKLASSWCEDEPQTLFLPSSELYFWSSFEVHNADTYISIN